MTLYYSIQTGGWYDTDFANYNLPDDVFELTREEWDTLRVQMNTGLILAIGEDGKLHWVQPPDPPAEEGRVQQRWNFRYACTNEIERTSFSSSALGSIHNYDCRVVDQINLKMRYDVANYNSQPEPIWASDGTRYEWINHTAAQLIGVMEDMNEHIKDKQVKLAQKMAAIDAAVTYQEVMAVSWD